MAEDITLHQDHTAAVCSDGSKVATPQTPDPTHTDVIKHDVSRKTNMEELVSQLACWGGGVKAKTPDSSGAALHQ